MERARIHHEGVNQRPFTAIDRLNEGVSKRECVAPLGSGAYTLAMRTEVGSGRELLTVGLGGVASHGCVALSERGRIVGVCEQERITRVRNAGFNASGLPDEALDACSPGES